MSNVSGYKLLIDNTWSSFLSIVTGAGYKIVKVVVKVIVLHYLFILALSLQFEAFYRLADELEVILHAVVALGSEMFCQVVNHVTNS